MKQHDAKTEQLIKQAKENRLSNPRLVLETARTLRDTAKENEDKELLGFADYCMVNAYFTLNDSDSVDHYGRRALPNLLGEENWNLAGRTYNLMALMALRDGDMAKGLEYLSHAMLLAEKYSLNVLGTMVYMNAADICIQLENIPEAYRDITIAETFLDQMEEEEEKALYYMVASSEAAICAKRLDLLIDYKKQRNILDGILKEHPELEHDANVLLLKYQDAQEAKDQEKEEELIEEIKEALFSSNEFLNYINELMSFLVILKESHKNHIVDEILEYIQQSLNGHESNGIMTRVSSFKVKYYLDTNQTEKLNQELYIYWNTARRLQKQSNEAVISLINAQRNLEASQRSNAKLKELADTDSLTSLPNRRAMNEKLDQLLELSYHKKHYMAVEMLDVDNFKHVNDTYGHSTGDDVLVLLGKCLKEISSDKIYTARYGGDEFVIAYDDMTDEEIAETAAKLKDLLCRGIESVSLPVFTISQGAVAAVPADDVKVWDYTSTADSALYTTKRKGKNDFLLVHSPSELQTINESLFPNTKK